MKTSLAPGSRVVTDYLHKTGLDKPLDELGFHTVGYGCTTCIGNSGPLPEPVAEAVHEGNLVAAAVLSGNRNFEGRINPLVKANYLASPPLVVAYALAGATDIDLTDRAAGHGPRRPAGLLEGRVAQRPEIAAAAAQAVRPEMFRTRYGHVFDGDADVGLPCRSPRANCIAWDPASTYIQEPPFLLDLPAQPGPIRPIRAARVSGGLGRFGDDRSHFARRVDRRLQPGRASYLQEQGVAPVDFNSYGSRRGNDRVMTRGTLRQHPHPQPPGPRHRGRRHPPSARRPGR